MKSLFTLGAIAGLGLFGSFEAQAWISCNGNSDLNNSQCFWESTSFDQQLTTPENVVKAPGYENGSEVHVCRETNKVPGKRVEPVNGSHSFCWIPWAGKELEKGSYQVLNMKPGTYEWEVVNYNAYTQGDNSGRGRHMIFSNMEGAYPTYICAVKDKHNNVMSGKYVNGYCWYSYGGHEYGVNPVVHNPEQQVYVLWAL